MAQKKRIRRGEAGWRQLFCRQSSSRLSVPEFCKREGINAALFRRWRSVLGDSEGDRRVISSPSERVAEAPGPFIDLGDLRSEGPQFEVRLELGSGIVLSIARS
jgi:transposase-like protein